VLRARIFLACEDVTKGEIATRLRVTPQTWWAIAAPKGTPAPIINRLNAELGQIMKLPDVQQKYAGLGVFPVHTTPERVLELVRLESPQMAKVLKAAGIEPE
jgi:tripartite-type tricarboxylate transporter receptor subunit TctC